MPGVLFDTIRGLLLELAASDTGGCKLLGWPSTPVICEPPLWDGFQEFGPGACVGAVPGVMLASAAVSAALTVLLSGPSPCPAAMILPKRPWPVLCSRLGPATK